MSVGRLELLKQANAAKPQNYLNEYEGLVGTCITSPPYRNAINYDMHVKDSAKSKAKDAGWYRGTGPYKDTRDWLNKIHAIFSNVYRLLKPGGICCIVIGDEIVNGTLEPLPSLLLSSMLNEKKWALRDMIIWHKVTGGAGRFRSTVKHPHVGNYHPNMMHEYILVLQKISSKSEIKRQHEKDADSMKRMIPLNHIMKREIANSLWNIAPIPFTANIGHPAPFPLQIPFRLLLVYHTGGIVLDPMCGSGQTLIAAKMLNMPFIGTDLQKSYVNLSESRLKKPSHSLSNWLVPSWHTEKFVFNKNIGEIENGDIDIKNSILPQGYKLKDVKYKVNKTAVLTFMKPNSSINIELIVGGGDNGNNIKRRILKRGR